MIFNPRNIIICLLLELLSANISAQVGVSAHVDAGESNVSDGFYLKSSILGSYDSKVFRVEGGGQFDMVSPDDNFLSAVTLILAKELFIKSFPFELQGLLIHDLFSRQVHETNWIVLAKVQRVHFTFQLGTEFRTFHITRKAARDYDIRSHRNLHENWNIVYLLGYDLKPAGHKWNAGASITNLDHFLVNQESNPLLNLHGRYQVLSPLTLFAETWYKSAGSLNISANYFSIMFRTGIIWNPWVKK